MSSMMERLVLGMTLHKYNLTYGPKWKFSFGWAGNLFQIKVETTVQELVGPCYEWKLRDKTITLTSPPGNAQQMHFWLCGIVNVFEYIEKEGLGYPVVAIA
jgi:hypothetical protein